MGFRVECFGLGGSLRCELNRSTRVDNIDFYHMIHPVKITNEGTTCSGNASIVTPPDTRNPNTDLETGST